MDVQATVECPVACCLLEATMACIGGTVEEPRPWIRFKSDQEERLDGRWCDRQQPFTSRRSCSSCPAYRGVRWDGTIATGIAPNGALVALTEDEYREYQAATEASFDGDDGPWRIFISRLEEGIGERALREIGDPDAQAAHAAYMRDYRKRMPDDVRERERIRKREYMRAYMRNRRGKSIVSVGNPRGS